jgi:hypothetical protein
MPGSRWGSKSLIFAMTPIPEQNRSKFPESLNRIKQDIRLPKPKVGSSSLPGTANHSRQQSETRSAANKNAAPGDGAALSRALAKTSDPDDCRWRS